MYRILLCILTVACFAACNLSDEPSIAQPNNFESGVCAEGRAFCNSHGDCISGDEATCECDPGYTGGTCDSCADGFIADGDDCIEDTTTCDDLTCEGNSSCQTDAAGGASCVCNDGWVGENCDSCEDGELEFPAGSGICEDDMCLDDPCGMIDNTTADSCTMPMADVFSCGCEDGYQWLDTGECEAQCEDMDGDGYGDGPACDGPDCLENDQNVQTPAQTTILSAVFTSGNDPEMLDRDSSVSIDVDYIFTRDANCPTCTTKLMAFYYSQSSHYIPWSTCVVAETAPAACAAGGTAGATTVNVPTPNHPGEYELRLLAVSDEETGCSPASATLQAETDPTLGDATIGTVQVTAGTCRPGAVSIGDIRFNQTAVKRYVATPGEVIDFQADWAIAEPSCTGCIFPLGIGWTGTRAGCLYSGNPVGCSGAGYSNMGQDQSLFDYGSACTPNTFCRDDTRVPAQMIAPTTPGIYPIRWATASIFNCEFGFGGTNPFNTIGVLEVQ